ncbi:MAG TPA: peptidoglycan-binding domain-containing protein [Candidatus Staskawiczbacteria bacterium]|nr:peptidoglycan-binding domain-containing protein [Candidatus Staskawiczbacteria bacterium]
MEFLLVKRAFLALGIATSLFFAFGAQAANVGDAVDFNVDKDFDALGRIKDQTTLIKITDKLYFYVERDWWAMQPATKQVQILNNLDELSNEFSSSIYPKLTSVFGSEQNPGIDKDQRITVLFEQMNSTEGGYFREADGYEKLQVPTSNEREMVYLSLAYMDNPGVKALLAHEFLHLVTFNQKNKDFNTEEDVWLNEARADYTSTLLGYDNKYEDSNLQKRVRDFVENPSDSLTEWSGTKYDYASVNLFTQYLVDHYGINILADSLKSQYVGIESINYALQKNGFKESFSDIFTNWTIALSVNNCAMGKNYCYSNENLKKIKVLPSINFLPLTGNVSLSVTNTTKNWTGNWLKFIGGNGDLTLRFSSLKGLNFKIPYIIEDSAGTMAVKFLALDGAEKVEIKAENFGTDYKSLTIIPSLQVNSGAVAGSEFPFNYAIEIKGAEQVSNEDLINQLLKKIAEIKQQIAALQAQQGGQALSCGAFDNNLYQGVGRSGDVMCLQQFLKNQGAEIYPEGYITGTFGSMTQAAVKRFQEKYGIAGTGYVGPLTRAKINELL